MKLQILLGTGALALALAACGGGGGSSPATSAGASAGASQPAGSSGEGQGDGLSIAAKDVKFSTNQLSAPADTEFTLAFDNQEALPHNVSISDSGGAKVFTGEVFTGPARRDYAVPALAAGSYTFICDVHPNMTGTLTAE